MRRLKRPITFCLNLATLLIFTVTADAQELQLSWEFQQKLNDASLRGLCVVDDSLIWASGSGGTVVKTADAGKSWKNVSPAGCEELDFRDIHAFDADNAVAINAGQPAVFYRTQDGGESWKKVFEHANESAFFDAVAAISSTHLIAMSDPVDDRILLVESTDAGETWTELPVERRPEKLPGEAGFAASGSNMITDPDTGTIFLALGSAEEGTEHESSRIVYSTDAAQTWETVVCPIKRNPSSGIFSLSYLPSKQLVAVGGDYLKPEEKAGIISIVVFENRVEKIQRRIDELVLEFNEMPGGDLRAFRSQRDRLRYYEDILERAKADPAMEEDNLATFAECIVPKTSPSGFRSGVTFTQLKNEHTLVVTVGTNGGDYSLDDGQTWQSFSEENFHAVKSTGSGTIWASGGKGRIAKLVISEPQTKE